MSRRFAGSAVALLIVLVLVFATDAARDDTIAGEVRAKSFRAPGLMIDRAAAPDIGTNAAIRDLVTAPTRDLVMAGRVDRAPACPAAQAAVACLRALRC